MGSQIEEVKSKVDIVSLVGEYIDLKKAGRNYKANCPFHGEKTPSFMVSPELQIYKCFGCGESGDVFSFLEKQEGMDFGEALRYLADKVGVKLKSQNFPSSTEREKIIEINNVALNFYNYVLFKHPQGKKVLDYLVKDRGLTKDTIKKFKLGYSPDKPGVLFDFLSKKKGFDIKSLSKSGLFAGRNYDRFGGRVVFPLMDHRGNIVGFSGRILPWGRQDRAKYINSPETPAYHKSKLLYGLNFSKNQIKKSKEVILVEGELDMVSPFQVGIENVVAIKGSALTEDQIRLLSRFTKKIVFCLDSDFAGNEAAKRGVMLADNLGLEVKVTTLSDFKDPDDAARGDLNSLKEDLKNAIGIWDFLIREIFRKYDLGGPGKAKISREITPILNQIKDTIVRSHYVEMVARKLSVPTESVLEQMKSTTKNLFRKNLPYKKQEDLIKIQEKPRRQLLEERLLYLVLNFYPEKILEKEIYDLFSFNFVLKVVEILKTNKDLKKLKVKEFFDSLPRQLQSKFSEMMFVEIEKRELESVINELKILSLRKDLEKLSVKIQEAEEKKNLKILKECQIEFGEKAKALSALEV